MLREISKAAQSPSLWVTEDGPPVLERDTLLGQGLVLLLSWVRAMPLSVLQDLGPPILRLPLLTCCQTHAEALLSQG